MKKIIVMLSLGFIFTACSNDSESDISDDFTFDTSIVRNYDIHVAPIIQSKCLNCHGATPANNASTSYHTFDLVKGNATGIKNRINLPSSNSLFMPRSDTPLSRTQLAIFDDWINDGLLENSSSNTDDGNNGGGDNTNKITFTNDIKSIIENNCGNCHTPGGNNRDYTDFSNASDFANTIANRINKTQGSGGFMPQNGTKLSQAELDKFEQWITDGKLQ